jgi:O-acetyl-ADP-ribose deacetylase (regulator of RNase III)
MKVVLAAIDARLAQAWQATCADLDGVSVHHGSIFEVACEALVSPANSFGFMDGGIDALYTQRFGWDLPLRLQMLIRKHHEGELPVGAADVVETGNPRHPFLIAAPTMSVPMVLDQTTTHPYLATRAVLRLVAGGTFASGRFAGEPVARHVTTIAFPGMGTGVGRVPALVCARQMRQALLEFQQG